MEIEAWWIWMIFAAIFVIAEIFTAGFFVLWFGVGAALAGVLALLGLSPGWQWGSFIIATTFLFLISRRFADRFTKDQPPGIGANRLQDKVGVVTEEIDMTNNMGHVKIEREDWRAEGEHGEVIPVGVKVKVLRVEGTRLIVKELNRGE